MSFECPAKSVICRYPLTMWAIFQTYIYIRAPTPVQLPSTGSTAGSHLTRNRVQDIPKPVRLRLESFPCTDETGSKVTGVERRSRVEQDEGSG